MSSGYAFSVGGLLRVSIVVLVVYGGLLALTYWTFQQGADRIHSAAGPRPADREHPTARLGVFGAHQSGRGQGRKDRPRNAGHRAHGRLRGQFVPVAGQQLQFRLDVHRPRPIRQAAETGAARHGDHEQPQQGLGREGPRGPGHGARGVADPGPGRRRRIQVHRRGPRRPRRWWPCRSRPTA